MAGGAAPVGGASSIPAADPARTAAAKSAVAPVERGRPDRAVQARAPAVRPAARPRVVAAPRPEPTQPPTTVDAARTQAQVNRGREATRGARAAASGPSGFGAMAGGTSPGRTFPSSVTLFGRPFRRSFRRPVQRGYDPLTLSKHVLFPGTFDPPTLGHVDLIRRGLRLFERVTVALAKHPTKQALFSFEERLALLEESTADLPGVGVVRLEGLVVHAAADLGCDAILRGVRTGSDYDYESQMAGTNRSLLPSVETVLLSTAPELAHVTSTLVRQVASMGGDPTTLVPGPVSAALRERFGAPREL